MRHIVRVLAIAVMACGVVFGSFGARGAQATSGTWTVSGTVTATSDAGSSIKTGDVFEFSITFNLDTASTGSTPSFANTFNDSISAFTFTRNNANVGTWDPSGITWPIAPATNVVTNSNGNNVTVQLHPTNAPAINSVAFFDWGLSFSWASNVLDPTWTAGTTTLATWMGTTNPPPTFSSVFFEMRDTSYNSVAFSVVVHDNSQQQPQNPSSPTVPVTVADVTTTALASTTTEAAVINAQARTQKSAKLPQTGKSQTDVWTAVLLMMTGGLIVAGRRKLLNNRR